MSDQERESRKRKLKENVIFGEKDKAESGETMQEGRSRASTRNKAILPLIFLLVLLIGLSIYLYSKRRFSRLGLRWTTEFSDKEGSVAEYLQTVWLRYLRTVHHIFPLPENCFGIRHMKWPPL